MVHLWTALHDWKPFSIDALGLVTLLGSEEVNASIGRLVPSRWFEYMPLLAGSVIAGDRFKTQIPSFHLYDISNGIYTTDLSFWFTRWMLAQKFTKTRSVVHWDVVERPRKLWLCRLIALTISFCFTGLLVVMAILSEDWYGLVNAVAIIVSIAVRTYIVQANRDAIDVAVVKTRLDSEFDPSALKQWRNRDNATGLSGSAEKTKPDDTSSKHQQAKIMIIMPDSKAITMFVPQQLIIPVLVRDPEPNTIWLYQVFRWLGWVAFAVHIVILGMVKLAGQIYTVALLVIPTVLICWKAGCDDSRWLCNWKGGSGREAPSSYSCQIGSRLEARVSEWPENVEFVEENGTLRRRSLKDTKRDFERSNRRQDLYAWLNLTDEEEDSLSKWDLLPHVRNKNDKWLVEYNMKKSLIRDSLPDMRGTRESGDEEAISHTGNPLESRGPQGRITGLTASGTTIVMDKTT